MFCNKCGVAVENNLRRCPQCGHLLKINKKELSFEEINDKGFHGEFNNKYETDEYVLSVKNDEIYNNIKNEESEYELIPKLNENYHKSKERVNKNVSFANTEKSFSESRYKSDLEAFRRNKKTTSANTEEKFSEIRYKSDLEEFRRNNKNTRNNINIPLVFILFFINPIFAIIYVLIVLTSNKTNGKK